MSKPPLDAESCLCCGSTWCRWAQRRVADRKPHQNVVVLPSPPVDDDYDELGLAQLAGFKL